MNELYLGDFTSRDQMAEAFCVTLDPTIEIIVACYNQPPYEGQAFVLFKQDGTYYEVNASHCSCYGLCEQDYSGDGPTQWQPEEANLKELVNRPRYASYDMEFQEDQEKIRARIREEKS